MCPRNIRKSIEQIRLRQIKNFMATLLLSQGVPMFVSGDECRRTQRGNNNAYCQDNAISWFDWRLTGKNEELRRFCRGLVAFRRSEPTVRQVNFLSGRPVRPGGLPDVNWYDANGEPIDWQHCAFSLACLLGAAARTDRLAPPNHHVLLFCHSGGEPQRFTVPSLVRDVPWRLLVNTAADSPSDIFPKLNGPPMPGDDAIALEPRSLVCYIAPDEA